MIDKTIERVRKAEEEASRIIAEADETASGKKAAAREKFSEELEKTNKELEKLREKIIGEYLKKAETEATTLRVSAMKENNNTHEETEKTEKIASEIVRDFLNSKY